MALKRISNLLIWIGIPAGVLITIFFTWVRFLKPPYPFYSSKVDLCWAIFYLAVFLIIGLSVNIRQGRGLFFFTLFAVILTVLYSTISLQIFWVFLSLLGIILSSLVIGHLFLKRISLLARLDIWEGTLISFSSGIAFLSALTFILGILHLYYTWLAWGLLAGITMLLAPEFYRHYSPLVKESITGLRQSLKFTDLRLWAFTLSTVSACGFGAYLWAIVPSIRYDALAYHIAAPVRYIQNHGLIPLPEAANTYWSHYAEMLYTLGLLLSDQPIPGLLHFSIGAYCLMIAYLTGKRIGGRRTAFLTLLLLTSLPIIGYESGTAYIDLFLTAYCLTGFYAGLSWWQDRHKEWLVIAGIMAGMALGTKISAGLILLPQAVLLVFLIFIHEGFNLTAIKRTFLVILPGMALFLPWLILDWHRTGNPVFPMLNSVFKSPLWQTQQDWFGYRGLTSQFLRNLLTLPWDLVANSPKYQHEAPVAILGALPFLSLPWFILGKKGIPVKVFRYALTVLGLTVLGTILLFLYAPNARYLMPIYPLMAILAAINLEILIELGTNSRFKDYLLVAGLALALIYFFSTRLAIIIRVTEFNERFPIKLVLGQESKEGFLSRAVQVYDAFQFLNHTGDGKHKVLSVGNEFRLYSHSQIYGLFFSHTARQLLSSAETESDLAKSLTRAGFEYLLISDGEMRWSPAYQIYPILNQEFLNHYTTLVFAQPEKGMYIYRLHAERVPQNDFMNLLKNSGFEEVASDGIPANWQVFGSPLLDTSGQIAHIGQNCAQIPGPLVENTYSGYFQDVSILPGQVYTLRYWVKAAGSSILQMQIDWLNAEEQIVHSTMVWKSLKDTWQEYRLSASAPSEATTARIYIITGGSGTAWFDDLELIQGGNGYTIGPFPAP